MNNKNLKTSSNGAYSPLYYDIAFDFRDIPKQTDFLEKVYEKFNDSSLNSILELGCGPGYFVEEFAKRGKRSVGLDLSPEMVKYSQDRLEKAGVKGELITGDMMDFSLSTPVDMAFLMMDSISHILSPDDFIKHLKSVAKSLNDGGIYFVECAHPSDNFKGDCRVKNSWVMERDGVKVETTWGDPGDSEDHIQQLTMTTVTLKVNEKGREFEIKEVLPQRYYFTDEIKAYARLSGVFEIVDWYGSMDINQPFDNTKKSWRMNIVLKKKS